MKGKKKALLLTAAAARDKRDTIKEACNLTPLVTATPPAGSPNAGYNEGGGRDRCVVLHRALVFHELVSFARLIILYNPISLDSKEHK